MTAETPAPPAEFACPHCQSGTLRLKRVVLARWLGGRFVTIPNFPGWVCDTCGEREYDSAALEQVKVLFGPDADVRRGPGRRAWRSMPDFHPAPRSSGRRRV
jgi:YgiT-type zinc finger domain-containing protein